MQTWSLMASSVFSPMPLTSVSPSTDSKGPDDSLWSTIFWAFEGPMPLSVCSSAALAVFMLTLPDAAAPACADVPTACDAPSEACAESACAALGTNTCSPSCRTRARFMLEDDASSVIPPAACTASATRDPSST